MCLHRECCRFFGDDGLTPKVFFTRVAPFGLLWILTNYLYLQALRKINTTDVSALFCCNKAFVFLLSWIVLRDRFMGVRVGTPRFLLGCSDWICRWMCQLHTYIRVELTAHYFCDRRSYCVIQMCQTMCACACALACLPLILSKLGVKGVSGGFHFVN